MATTEESLEDAGVHHYRQEQTRRKRERHVRTAFKDAIERGHDAVSLGEIDRLGSIVDEALRPLLGIDTRSDALKISQLLRQHGIEHDPDPLIRAVHFGGETLAEMGDSRTLRDAFSILEQAGSVVDLEAANFQRSQPMTGLASQLGVRYVRPDSSAGGTLELYDAEEYEPKAVIFTGRKGMGKSTAIGTWVEDRIQAGHKIIDVVDLTKAENVLYDIPAQNDGLQQWRQRLGLSTGFEDYDPPAVEILAPLSQELADSRVPVGPDDEPEVRPFTIAAADLNYRQLVMMLPHTTTTQENYLKAAYQKLQSESDDYSLLDLAEAVRFRTNAGDKVADRIERGLATIQDRGYVRDKRSEYNLDFERIFEDPGTVTAFTQMMLRERHEKKAILSYILDSIHEERERLHRRSQLAEFPVATIVMREMHWAAPRTSSEQESERKAESYMLESLQKTLALTRHGKVELLGDTQLFSAQLDKQAREQVDEIYCFSGKRGDLKKIFKSELNNDDPVEKIVRYDTGECARVAYGEATYPIRIAPPRFHHLEAKGGDNGIGFRARILEDIDLVDAPWSHEVPQRLNFHDGPDDAERYFKEALRFTGHQEDYVFTNQIVEGYKEWRSRGDNKFERNHLLRRLNEYFKLDDDNKIYPTFNGKRLYAYKGLVFNQAIFDRAQRNRLFGEQAIIDLYPDKFGD